MSEVITFPRASNLSTLTTFVISTNTDAPEYFGEWPLLYPDVYFNTGDYQSIP